MLHFITNLKEEIRNVFISIMIKFSFFFYIDEYYIEILIVTFEEICFDSRILFFHRKTFCINILMNYSSIVNFCQLHKKF